MVGNGDCCCYRKIMGFVSFGYGGNGYFFFMLIC